MTAERDNFDGKDTLERAKQLLLGAVDTIFQVASKKHSESDDAAKSSDSGFRHAASSVDPTSQVGISGSTTSRTGSSSFGSVGRCMSTGACSNFSYYTEQNAEKGQEVLHQKPRGGNEEAQQHGRKSVCASRAKLYIRPLQCDLECDDVKPTAVLVRLSVGESKSLEMVSPTFTKLAYAMILHSC